jgi:hypothetical protein
MKRNSYLGGHTVLTQKPSAYMKQMERDAVANRKRADRMQQHHDKYTTDPQYRREFDKQAFARLDKQRKRKR